MELTLVIIQREMLGLLTHFPEAGYTGKTLSPLAKDWLELLREELATEREFLLAIREVKKHCRFWPKLAEVLQAIRQERSAPTQRHGASVAQIADTSSSHNLTPEEKARNLRRIETIQRMLRKELTREEALADMEKDTPIDDFQIRNGHLVEKPSRPSKNVL